MFYSYFPVDQVGVDVIVTSLAAVRTLWWQRNTDKKCRELSRIHDIRKTKIVPLDVSIGIQILFVQYCHQRHHLILNTDI